MTARLESFFKPVIAAVNGIAFGGGGEIAEAAPLAVASDRATFAKPESISQSRRHSAALRDFHAWPAGSGRWNFC